MPNCIPIFSQVIEECRTQDQLLTCYVEIDIDDHKNFPFHVQLTMTAGCWIKFCMYLMKVICLHNYYNLYYHRSYTRVQ
jgi:hypothetical protein